MSRAEVPTGLRAHNIFIQSVVKVLAVQGFTEGTSLAGAWTFPCFPPALHHPESTYGERWPRNRMENALGPQPVDQIVLVRHTGYGSTPNPLV